MDFDELFAVNVRALDARSQLTIPSITARYEFLNEDLKVQYPQGCYPLNDTPLNFQVR